VHINTSQASGDALSASDVEVFNDSLERCTSTRRFLDCFYELFISSSPEVAAKFATTDFRTQKAALKVSLYMVMSSIERKPEGKVHLERIAARHSRSGLDIGPHLYDLWLDCLVQAVRECDPLFGEETEQAWRRVMQVGIEFLKSRYVSNCLRRPGDHQDQEGFSGPAAGPGPAGPS
jgi:hemoglobin-like flavoprotein